MLLLADDDAGFRFTEAEAAMVGRLAQVRAAADSGNRKAKAKIAQVQRQMLALQRQAKRGNARAARAARVLEESGLFVQSQSFDTVMEGADAAGASWNPWNWRAGNVRVTPVALFAAAGLLAWTKHWKLAAVPVVVWGLHEGHQKAWW